MAVFVIQDILGKRVVFALHATLASLKISSGNEKCNVLSTLFTKHGFYFKHGILVKIKMELL